MPNGKKNKMNKRKLKEQFELVQIKTNKLKWVKIGKKILKFI